MGFSDMEIMGVLRKKQPPWKGIRVGRVVRGVEDGKRRKWRL